MSRTVAHASDIEDFFIKKVWWCFWCWEKKVGKMCKKIKQQFEQNLKFFMSTNKIVGQALAQI
jgi:hypothetical protein